MNKRTENYYSYIKKYKNWVSRANAFKRIIFPSAKRRISLQMKYGRMDLAQETLLDVVKVVKIFVKKVKTAQHAKAFYIIKRDFEEFMEEIGMNFDSYQENTSSAKFLQI